MGQRHQVFLIARVRPQNGDPAYRCVAAFHHQWCYGTLPLFAMHRFLRLLSRPENAAIVRAELRDMDGKYGRTSKMEKRMPATPCPYSASLVALAWTTNLDSRQDRLRYEGVTLRHDVRDANMGCWDGHNDDGISIIDVTDPGDPAYCFLNQATPLSAYAYLSSYYDLIGTRDDAWIHRCYMGILNLCGIRLLAAEALQEAWPDETFRSPSSKQDHVVKPENLAFLSDWESRETRDSVLTTAAMRMVNNPKDDEPGRWFAALDLLPSHDPQDLVDSQMKMKSLLLRHPQAFNFYYAPAPVPVPSGDLEHLLRLLSEPEATGDDRDSQLSALAAARVHVKSALRLLSPFPDEYLEDLVKITITKGGHFADLSGYHLSVAQIIRFVSQCPDLDALDVSDNPHLTTGDIPDILLAAPFLLRVNVSGCRGIDGAALLDFVRTHPSLFRTLEALVHPAFLTIVKPPNVPIAFTFMFADTEGFSGIGLPLFTPTQVLQALRQLLPLIWRSEIDRMARSSSVAGSSQESVRFYLSAYHRLRASLPGSMPISSSMLAYAAFSGGSQRPGESWSDRPVASVPLQPYPAVSAEPDGSWAFFLDWSNPTHGTQKWAFLRYRPSGWEDEDGPSAPTVQRAGTAHISSGNAASSYDGDVDAARSALEGTPEVPLHSDLPPECTLPPWRGKVYDLRGFLRCVVEEGRSPPPEELVTQLEEILNARHQHDGSLVCPLMEDKDTPMALSVIPQAPIEDDDGDERAREMFTLASGLHSRLRSKAMRRSGDGGHEE